MAGFPMSTMPMFAPPSPVFIPVAGETRGFPVRRIYCVGRNYADHIREMGGDERDPPFFFQKPTDAIVLDGAEVDYPPFTDDFQHEVELVIAIGKDGAGIAPSQAASHIFGLAVGIDLTRRDVQVAARRSGRPWEIGKSFDQSAPCGPLRALQQGPLPATATIELRVNGELRQAGHIDQMIWSCEEIVGKLSEQYRLVAGDLIYTGTPAGVGPLRPGDRVEAAVSGLPGLSIGIRPR